jgi:hypothetical protein
VLRSERSPSGSPKSAQRTDSLTRHERRAPRVSSQPKENPVFYSAIEPLDSLAI